MSSENKKTNFDLKASSWDKKPLRQILAEKAASAIINNIQLTGKIKALEFGCGTGLVTLSLAPKLKSILAVDSSKAMLNELNNKIIMNSIKNIKTMFLDIENDKNQIKEKFNLIYSAMTLHHIQNIEVLITSFLKMLSPKGILALIDLEKEDGTFHNDNTGVMHFGFEKTYIKNLLSENNFKNITYQIIHTIKKEDSEKDYPVFLATGSKA
ncbi:MAG: class I SAM-dependent methyltransferase [Spirochaetia bacterium]|nr:class I SAM-dependent methyltransferase [Spirochaetia bacterium]